MANWTDTDPASPAVPQPEGGLFRIGASEAAWAAGIFMVVGLACAILVAAGAQPSWSYGVCSAACCLLASASFALLVQRVTNQQAASRELERRTSDLQDDIRRHRKALDQFASGLDVFIIIVDSRMTVQYSNTQADAAFGGHLHEGQSLLATTLSSDLEALTKRAIDSAQPQKSEIVLHHPQNRICMVQVWGQTPEFQRYFIAIYDQTSMKRLERVRRDFVANVSHELRTPMTTIRAMAETLMDEDGADVKFRRRYLGTIIREVDRLTGVTKDLLTLSMVDGRTMTKSAIDLARLVNDAVPIARARCEQKGLSLLVSVPDCLPMMGNASLLSQVVANLLENAVNYTAKGHISVSLQEKDGLAVLEVRDSGIGIASDHLPRVFERFYRVDKGRSREKGGTGLGLSIVRNIVEAHGGHAAVESSLNEGSCFRVEVPTELP